MKGVSPLISTVLLVGIVIIMAAVIGPWALRIATEASEGARTDVEKELICRQTAYSFDSDYGNSGVVWNLSGTIGTVSVKIINTGSQNLYNFSFELMMQAPGGARIITHPDVNITTETQKTKANPLKPGYGWVVDADITNINDTWSLSEVKLINEVCPRISPSVSL